jgi:RNA polymerase sigma-70 factor (ECF subfamily)
VGAVTSGMRIGGLRVIRWREAHVPPRPGRPGGRGEGAGIQVDETAIRANVERARTGDTDAFGALFRAFEADVQRLCARMLGDEAADASQETFLRAQRSLDGYDAGQPFRRWLLSIAAHLAVDRLRRRATEGRIFAPEEIDVEALPAAGPSPLHGELQAERQRQLVAALDALPDRYRAPLVLRYFADLDYETIAATLGITRGQVATLLFRGRHRLRACLTEGDADGGGAA